MRETRRVIGAVLAGLCVAVAAVAAPADAATRKCDELLVRMSDGVRLHAWVSRMPGEARRPLLFMMDSYARGGMPGRGPRPDNVCPQSLPDDYVPAYLSTGVIDRFTLVQVSYRGTGASEGVFDLTGRRTQRDVREAVAWAAAQPWSNGDVVLTGESGTGFAQFHALREPHVRAAVLFTSCADMYRCVYRGGQYNSLADVYLASTLEGYAASLPARLAMGAALHPSPVQQTAALTRALAETKARGVNDAWWRERSALPRLPAVRVPVLYTSDLYDIVQPFDALQQTPGARLNLGMGHLSVDLAKAGGDRYRDAVRAQVDRFVEHYGLGVDNGAERDPRVTLLTNLGGLDGYYAGHALARGEAAWPLPSTRWTRLYLGAGTLAPAGPRPGAAGDRAVLAPVPGTDLRASGLLLGTALATDLRGAESGGLTYTTPVLERDLEVTGPISLRLFARSTAADFDWSVRLTDVWPDGRSEWISDGNLRASLRRVDPRRSLRSGGRTVRPWHTFASPEPVPPGEVVEYAIDVIGTSNVFRAGHRLRLDLLPAGGLIDSPRTLGLGSLTVLRDARHPSSLLLPVIPDRCDKGVALTPDTPPVGPCARSFAEALQEKGRTPFLHARRAAGRDAHAKALSRKPVRERASWRRHVLDPPEPYVYPKAVAVEGDAAAVDDADALTRPGGAATLRGTQTRLVLDLGVNTGGIVEATVTAGSGATVRLAYSEARKFLTPIGDTGQNSLGSNDEPHARFDTFPGRAGTSFASPATRGGQRWVLLALDGPGTVTLRDVRVRVQHLRAAADDYKGRFLSSDPVLNRAWYASAYTFNASTTGDTMVIQDGAKRDRMVFAGDLGIAELVALNTVGQGPQVIRNSLRLLSCQPELLLSIATYSNTDVKCPEDPAQASPLGPPPPIDPANPSPLAPLQGQAALPSGEYVAWYVLAAATYHHYTADAAYVRNLLPVLRRGMAFLRALEVGGLYYAPLDYTWRAGLTSGHSPYTNSVYYAALRGLAQLEREIGRGAGAAASLDAHAEAVRTALVAKFLDPATGALLADPANHPGVHLQDANVMAPLQQVLRGDQAGRALAHVAATMQTRLGTRVYDRDAGGAFGPEFISPFMTSWELLARLERRDTQPALDLIRRLWGHMTATDPQSTVWEKVALSGEVQPNQPNPGGEPTTRDEGEGYVSLAHAWSGGPVPALSGYVLGARPVESGYRRWIVAPQPGDLRWAQGQVPTPAGALVVRWERGASRLRVTVGAPPGTSGTVEVPLLGRDRTIARDGVVVWHRGRPRAGSGAVRDGDIIRFEQAEGMHTYGWRAAKRGKR